MNNYGPRPSTGPAVPVIQDAGRFERPAKGPVYLRTARTEPQLTSVFEVLVNSDAGTEVTTSTTR